MELAEFSIHTVTFLVDSIHKTRCKWAVDDFTQCSNNNLITLLIINTRAKSVTYMKESLIICHYQVDELDYPDINNINYVNEDDILLW